jgi:hypothetical protein
MPLPRPLALTCPADHRHSSPAEAEAALRAAPEADRKAVYEARCFFLAAERLFAGRDEAPAAELLIIPVGTQAYSPLLAMLAAPAQRVALLVTEPQGEGARSPGSRPTAAEIIETVRAGWPVADGAPLIELFSIGDGLDGARVSDAVGSALFWAGDPWPIDVTIDVSGGRKATTAALGALGGGLGFRLAYIEGRHVIAGYYMDERRHALADAAGIIGIENRQTATALLEAGAFAAAERCFADVCQSTLAGRGAVFLRALAQALAAGDSASLQALADDTAALGLGGGAAHMALLDITLSPVQRAAAVVDGLRRDGAWR